MHVQKYSVTLVTATGGDATDYTLGVNGLLDRIVYVKTDFASTADIAVTLEDTGESLWTESNVNASVTKNPRQPVHTTSGGAALFATGISMRDRVAVNGRVKIAVAQGGNTKTGSFTIITI